MRNIFTQSLVNRRVYVPEKHRGWQHQGIMGKPGFAKTQPLLTLIKA
jgi:hypothetical protein